ncbi:hypothetical protein D3C81_1942730 [compost metagenome]
MASTEDIFPGRNTNPVRSLIISSKSAAMPRSLSSLSKKLNGEYRSLASTSICGWSLIHCCSLLVSCKRL